MFYVFSVTDINLPTSLMSWKTRARTMSQAYPSLIWRETSPGIWQRDVDEAEKFYYALAKLYEGSGRMFFAMTGHLCVSVDIPQGQTQEAVEQRLETALRHGWLALRYVDPADRMSEFRSIIEKMRHFYEAVRDDTDHYALSLPIWEAGCPELPKSDALPPVPPPKSKPSVSISSMGNVDEIIAPKQDQIAVDKPWVTGEELGNGLGLFLGTLRSKMSLGAAYNDAWHNKAEVEGFVHRCRDILLTGLGLVDSSE